MLMHRKLCLIIIFKKNVNNYTTLIYEKKVDSNSVDAECSDNDDGRGVGLNIYLTPVKTQLLQYYLTLDLMLFCHSYQIKIKTHEYLVAISVNVLFVLVKQSR